MVEPPFPWKPSQKPQPQLYLERSQIMTTHTPGPWTISGDLIVGAPESRPNPKVAPFPHSVAKLCWDFDGDRNANGELPWTTAVENARLIASAPDMLEALQLAADILATARQYFPKSIKNNDKFALELACAAVGKAIANAKGEQ